MKANNKKIFLILSILTFLLAGCAVPPEPVEVILKPDSTQPQNNNVMNEAISKRFQDPATKGQTVVDSAIELSKKNSELFQQITALRQKNQELTAENRRFKNRIAVLEPELKQAKKELNEANDLLIEMRIELNNWKSDILGFRNEIRDADKAQLEALLKILEVLGGEVKLTSGERKTGASNEQKQKSTTASPKPNGQTQPGAK